jgi:hypothetical protein
MCIPGVVGPTLDYHVARPQSRFAAFENERRFSLQETNDVDRMGLMHSWMARLIDDVTASNAANRSRAVASRTGLGTPSGRGLITNQRTWKLPFRGPSTGRVVQRSSWALGVKAPTAASSQISNNPPRSGLPISGRGAPVNDNDRLALGIVSSDYTAHGVLKF